MDDVYLYRVENKTFRGVLNDYFNQSNLELEHGNTFAGCFEFHRKANNVPCVKAASNLCSKSILVSNWSIESNICYGLFHAFSFLFPISSILIVSTSQYSF